MKVLLFITGHRQLKEYHYFNIFLNSLNLKLLCDIYIYCNNPEISGELLQYYKEFPQKNKYIFITSLNHGYTMGGAEAVNQGIKMGIFHGYDYVIHLHPDVFITDDSYLMNVLHENEFNDTVFLLTKYFPGDNRHFAFDFFIFKPKLLTINIFTNELYTYTDSPEHYLYYIINKYNIKHKVVKRFDNDNWYPRRIDDHLKLYHEHDLEKVETYLKIK